MKATLEVKTKNGSLVLDLSSIEATTIILGRHGFDLDLDPGVDSVQLTASNTGVSVSVKGKTLDDACEKLLERIL